MLKDIEALLLEEIGKGNNTAGDLLLAFPASLVLKHNAFRTIDNGLRRLVKQGKIKFMRSTRTWALAENLAELKTSVPMSEKSLVNPVG